MPVRVAHGFFLQCTMQLSKLYSQSTSLLGHNYEQFCIVFGQCGYMYVYTCTVHVHVHVFYKCTSMMLLSRLFLMGGVPGNHARVFSIRSTRTGVHVYSTLQYMCMCTIIVQLYVIVVKLLL